MPEFASDHTVRQHITKRDHALAEIIEEHGGRWGVRTVWEARQARMPISLACSFLTQETGWSNVFGHDGGTIYAGAGTVTKTKYLAYKAERGHTRMQGVGPMQLTWWSYQDAADAVGGCWVPAHNIHVGLGLAASLIRSNGYVHGVARYNGSGDLADAYSRSVRAGAVVWHNRLMAVVR